MKKIYKLIMACLILTPMVAGAKLFTHQKDEKRFSKLKLVESHNEDEKEFCAYSSGNPSISICIYGDDTSKLNRKLIEKSVQKVTSSLVKQHTKYIASIKEESSNLRIFANCTSSLDWDDVECGGPFCTVNPTEPECINCTSSTDWDDSVCGGPFCTVNPTEPECINCTSYMDWDDTICGGPFCTVNPTEPECQ